MNRIFAMAAPAQTKTNRKTRFDQGKTASGERRACTHTAFAPLHYEPNYAYPLLIWLHNCGGDERQLNRVMPHISMRNYVAVGVRGPSPCEDRRGFTWRQEEDAIHAAEQRVLDAIHDASGRFNINHQRVFVAGYETGGSMAFRLALRRPGKFAGALGISSPFPTSGAPLAKFSHLRDLPLFLAYSRDSLVYTTDDLCEQLPLFHSAGLKVAIRQYPCGDELTTQMLQDMDSWMMEQVTGAPAAETALCQPDGRWN